MSPTLLAMIEKARRVRMSPRDREEQRISFAFGNTHYEDSRVTRDQVVRSSISLNEARGTRDGSRA